LTFGGTAKSTSRPIYTAATIAQWDRNLSPLKVSPKREFLWFWLETFGIFSLKLSFFGAWRPIGNVRKARKMRGFYPKGAHYL
jgi:hypothetical protein